MNLDHFPFSSFTEALRSTLVKLILLFLTIYLAVVSAACLYDWGGQLVRDGEITVDWHLNDLFAPVAIYPVLLIVGIAQLWGIAAYLAILIFAIFFLQDQIRCRWLVVPFLIQFWETYRLLYTECI